MEKHTVSASLTDNTKYMNRALPVKKSFDIIERNLIIGGQNSAFYFIDGFTKDETMLKLMDSFLNISADDMPEDATSFSTSCIPYVEVDILGDFDSIFKNLLSGVTCLFITAMKPLLPSTAVLTRPAASRNQIKTNPCAVPVMALWKQSYSILP